MRIVRYTAAAIVMTFTAVVAVGLTTVLADATYTRLAR